ncbi:hypothetical protein [Flavobacterium succinicans]|uniref:MG2 domain protein n=1 Tax=Flavobacterium succinicans TaxID=29536 RepID=A0A199XP70_9FLAO|nr:hypothetical protein [Flavobacterium succinicans]OAZ03056.1 hypothetical protein FLB_27310 [Flavobacterium succinicans]
MKNYSTIITLICILVFQNSRSQSNTSSSIDKEYIKKSLENYFSLDRENIHLHLNKNEFLTSEKIWFKGYIANRKQTNATIKTTNIQVALLNEKGEKIQHFLFLANNNSFSGNINLKEKYPTGKYYLQVYTNWMNNFTEDESSTYPITITNIDEKNTIIAATNSNNVNTSIFPEGGTLVANTKNSIGINISNGNGKAIPNTQAWLISSKKEKLMLLSLNEDGNGRFDFVPTTEDYFILVESGNKVVEKQLPKASTSGIALTVNNYFYDKKTIVSAMTNSETIEKIQNKALYLVIHKDDKSHILDLKLSESKIEDTFEIPNNILFNGVNYFRIIDGTGKQYAERMVYNNLQTITNTFDFKEITQDKSTTTLGAKTTQNSYNLSVAVQPEYNSPEVPARSIIGDLLLNPYLTTPMTFETQSISNQATLKEKHSLDLVLLNQNKHKYEWKNIVANPPKKMHANENGLTIIGNINESLKNYEDYKVRIYSINNLLMEFADINKNGHFEFNNLFLPDSIPVHFTFYKKKNLEEVNLKYTTKTKTETSPFRHSFVPNQNDTPFIIIANSLSPLITEKRTVKLKEVVAQKSSLKHQYELGGLTYNNNMKAYKVKPSDLGRTVLSYLQSNGFITSNSIPVEISSNRQGRNSVDNMLIQLIPTESPSSMPSGSVLTNNTRVYLDNLLLTDLDRLFNFFMEDLDEIYIDRRPNIIEGSLGVIKLYSKVPQDNRKSINSVIIANGYNHSRAFTPEDTLVIDDMNYKNLNCIFWQDYIESSANGIVNFDIPKTASKKVRLIIEGISNDGQLISTSQIVNLN